MARTITPKTMDNGEGFEMDRPEGKKRFCKCEGRMDDEMEGDYRNPRFLMEPLKVVLCPHLKRCGFCGEVGSQTIEGTMVELSVRKVRVESSKLSIRPPVLLGGKGVDKVGRTGGEGALRKFRGDY